MGGQLAVLAGNSNNVEEFEDEFYRGISSKISAIINIDGLMDIFGEGAEEFEENPNNDNPRSAHKWLGASHIENRNVCEKASDYSYVNKNSCLILFLNS